MPDLFLFSLDTPKEGLTRDLPADHIEEYHVEIVEHPTEPVVFNYDVVAGESVCGIYLGMNLDTIREAITRGRDEEALAGIQESTTKDGFLLIKDTASNMSFYFDQESQRCVGITAFNLKNLKLEDHALPVWTTNTITNNFGQAPQITTLDNSYEKWVFPHLGLFFFISSESHQVEGIGIAKYTNE